MKTIDAKVTSQWQVTIPAEVRRHLKLDNGARLTFVIGDDGVWIEPARFTLESVFGSVPAVPGTSDDFDEEIERAMAAEVEHKLNSGNDE